MGVGALGTVLCEGVPGVLIGLNLGVPGLGVVKPGTGVRGFKPAVLNPGVGGLATGIGVFGKGGRYLGTRGGVTLNGVGAFGILTRGRGSSKGGSGSELS